MAISATQYVSADGSDVAEAFQLKGFSKDESKRTSELQKYRNAAKSMGAKLITRGESVFIVKNVKTDSDGKVDDERVALINAENKVVGRGRPKGENPLAALIGE